MYLCVSRYLRHDGHNVHRPGQRLLPGGLARGRGRADRAVSGGRHGLDRAHRQRGTGGCPDQVQSGAGGGADKSGMVFIIFITEVHEHLNMNK